MGDVADMNKFNSQRACIHHSKGSITYLYHPKETVVLKPIHFRVSFGIVQALRPEVGPKVK